MCAEDVIGLHKTCVSFTFDLSLLTFHFAEDASLCCLDLLWARLFRVTQINDCELYSVFRI